MQTWAWFEKGSGTFVRSTLRAVPAKVPDPFSNHAIAGVLLGSGTMWAQASPSDTGDPGRLVLRMLFTFLIVAACVLMILSNFRIFWSKKKRRSRKKPDAEKKPEENEES